VITAEPYAVDACSGVESRPGKKDAARMKALVQAVHSARKRRKR
jgi:phosphoribosylanthranilate isomerase